MYRIVLYCTVLYCIPSVLWQRWLGGRKGIQPVKNWVVRCWRGVWSEVQTCIWSSWCHCHSLSLASVKSRLALPFWYRLTWVVLEKGPLNGLCALLQHSCTRSEWISNLQRAADFNSVGVGHDNAAEVRRLEHLLENSAQHDVTTTCQQHTVIHAHRT